MNAIANALSSMGEMLTTIKDVVLAIGTLLGVVGDILGFIGFKVFILLMTTAFVLWLLNLVSPNGKKINYPISVAAGILVGLRAKMPWNPIILKYLFIIISPVLVSYLVNIMAKILRYIIAQDYLKIKLLMNKIHSKIKMLSLKKVKKIFTSKQSPEVEIILMDPMPTGEDVTDIKQYVEIMGFKTTIHSEDTLVLTEQNGAYISNNELAVGQIAKAINDGTGSILWLWSELTSIRELPYLLEENKFLKQKKVIIGSGAATTFLSIMAQKWSWIGYNYYNLRDLIAESRTLEISRKNPIAIKTELAFVEGGAKFDNVTATVMAGDLNNISTFMGTKYQLDFKNKIFILDLKYTPAEDKFLQLFNHFIDTEDVPQCVIINCHYQTIDIKAVSTMLQLALDKLRANTITLPLLINKNNQDVFECFIGASALLEHTKTGVIFTQKI